MLCSLAQVSALLFAVLQFYLVWVCFWVQLHFQKLFCYPTGPQGSHSSLTTSQNQDCQLSERISWIHCQTENLLQTDPTAYKRGDIGHSTEKRVSEPGIHRTKYILLPNLTANLAFRTSRMRTVSRNSSRCYILRCLHKKAASKLTCKYCAIIPTR